MFLLYKAISLQLQANTYKILEKQYMLCSFSTGFGTPLDAFSRLHSSFAEDLET